MSADQHRPAIVDISDLPTNRIHQYAQDSEEVYFERKGGRTFLIAD